MTGPFTPIGKIKKSHGVKGELRVQIEAHFMPDFSKAKLLFLGNEQSCIPYFLLKFRSEPNLIIKLEDVDSKEQADALGKQAILLPESEISHIEIEAAVEATGNNFLIGYELRSEEKPIGPILRIDEYPQQDMIICQYQGREVLIPLHEALIKELDEDHKVLTMLIPEGLLEL